MEFKRKEFERRITQDIEYVQGSIRRIEVEISHIRQQTSEFATRQIEKLRIKMEEYQNQLNKLTSRLKSINQGGIDEEIKEEERQLEEISRQASEQKLWLDKCDELKTAKTKQIISRVNSHEYQARRDSRLNWDKEYNIYMKKSNSIPANLKSKLDRLPYNRGIIFKGIWFYGKQRAERGPQIMSERIRNQTYNHIFNGETYKLEELSPYVQIEPGKKRPKRKPNKVIQEKSYKTNLENFFI